MSTRNILGISAGFHDAAATVINGNNGDIIFASHSERFSKHKHDATLSPKLIEEALSYGTIEKVAYYENHLKKKYRQIRAGQGLKDIHFTLRGELAKHFPNHPVFLSNVKVQSFNHHKSHAAAGFQTSPFRHATVVVIDAIGEMETITVWDARYDKKGFAQYKLLHKEDYPHSIGLFYSAMTQSVGLRPLDEEYILMGMAAYGDSHKIYDRIRADLIESINPVCFKENLHIGVSNSYLKLGASDFDVAAATQILTEEMIEGVMEHAADLGESPNLVYMGGVALNCSANRHLGNYFNNLWIMPNPGDAGSSLGAAALAYGKRLNWHNAYLGHNIEGEYPVEAICRELTKSKICGVANGRAEFGPRALGNRSLLADPRGKTVKDKVNAIKQRQQFRPFAPAILAEHAEDYFYMPNGFARCDYMQVVAPCLEPNKYPAIVHADGTSRVQTVPKNNTGFRRLLEAWYKQTGCPMLLNTSLNIRGMPMVNDESDAKDFEEYYGVKVFTGML